MKTMAFARRCAKEMLRDKLNLIMGIGFPVVILLLLTLIQANIPVELFALPHLTPGVLVFGLSFISLFSAMLIAKDRSSSFMLRLYTSPMRAAGYILGYLLPLLPMAVAQSVVCLLVAFLLGLPVTANCLALLFVLLPVDILFIAVGLLCGSLLTDKQASGICGALLTNLTAWFSGTWFDVKLVGGVFYSIASALPFLHAVEAGRAALSGNLSDAFPALYIVIVYAAALMALAVLAFTKKMKGDQ